MITTGRTAILERNVFLERFLTYRVVFREYFKTMDLIARGEALKHETYTRLADNFLINVKNYSQLCLSFIHKHQLRDTIVEEHLDNYFIELIEGLKCMDLNNNELNRSQMQLAQQRIDNSEKEFVNTIAVGLK